MEWRTRRLGDAHMGGRKWGPLFLVSERPHARAFCACVVVPERQVHIHSKEEPLAFAQSDLLCCMRRWEHTQAPLLLTLFLAALASFPFFSFISSSLVVSVLAWCF